MKTMWAPEAALLALCAPAVAPWALTAATPRDAADGARTAAHYPAWPLQHLEKRIPPS